MNVELSSIHITNASNNTTTTSSTKTNNIEVSKKVCKRGQSKNVDLSTALTMKEMILRLKEFNQYLQKLLIKTMIERAK